MTLSLLSTFHVLLSMHSSKTLSVQECVQLLKQWGTDIHSASWYDQNVYFLGNKGVKNHKTQKYNQKIKSTPKNCIFLWHFDLNC